MYGPNWREVLPTKMKEFGVDSKPPCKMLGTSPSLQDIKKKEENKTTEARELETVLAICKRLNPVTQTFFEA